MSNTIDAMHKLLEFDFQQGDFTFHINKLSKSVKLCISTEDTCLEVPEPSPLFITDNSCDVRDCDNICINYEYTCCGVTYSCPEWY